MTFDWREYLTLSRFLQAQTEQAFSHEAACRSAVSRAYYSAFCCARNYARDRQAFLPFYDSRDHAEVRGHFVRQPGQSEIASLLGSLRQWRNHCDYRDTVRQLPKMVVDSIKAAQDVFDMLW